MNKETLLIACGIHSIFFALFHISFWKAFAWKSELRKLNSSNRAIMQIMNIRLIYLFFFVAFLCFFYSADLYGTNLGKAFLTGISLFWLGRIIEQFIFLGINHWKVHLLTLLFLIGFLIFLLPVLI